MSDDIYDVITVPHVTLKSKAQDISRVDDEVRGQMDKMMRTMYSQNGIGLAANQVDLLNRVLVVDVGSADWNLVENKDGIFEVDVWNNPEKEESQPLFLANPKIIWNSEEKSVYPEGCLSIPEQFADVIRPAKVRISYLDYDNNEQEIEADGLLSHCLQHEMDHLDGKLCIDYLSSIKRDIAIRKVQKLKKSHQIL